jgi:4-carboxymuconolactone decarboxylase
MSPRFNPPDPTSFDSVQQRVHDAIANGPRGGVPPPLQLWLTRPALADVAQRLGQYARYGSSLPAELSELAILVVARHWDAEFEWYTHKPIAVKAGVSAEIIDGIRTGRMPAFDDARQAAVYEFSQAVLRGGDVADAVYDRALDLLGYAALVDLVAILGYYAMIAMTIKVFQIPLPDGVEPNLRR